MAQPHHGVLLIPEKEPPADTHGWAGSHRWGAYAERKKPGSKRYLLGGSIGLTLVKSQQ